MLGNAHIAITYYFHDDDDTVGKATLNIPLSAAAVADTVAAAFAQLLTQVSDAALRKYSITHSTYNDASPAPAGDGNWQAAFFYDAGGAACVHALPAISSSKLLADGITINTADGDVHALIQLTINGINGIAPCHPFGIDITSFISAYKQHRL